MWVPFREEFESAAQTQLAPSRARASKRNSKQLPCPYIPAKTGKSRDQLVIHPADSLETRLGRGFVLRWPVSRVTIMRTSNLILCIVACAFVLRAATYAAADSSGGPRLQAVVFGDDKNRVEFLDYPGPDAAAPTVVLLHGGNCTAGDWSTVAPRLAKHYRVVVPDGFVHPFDPWRLWLLLDHLQIRRAALLGHSAGGPVIRSMYRLAPERVWALVDIDGSALGPLTLARNLPNDRYSPTAAALYEKNKAQMLQLKSGHQGDYPSEVTIDRRLTAYKRAQMSPEERAATRTIEKVTRLPAAPPPPAMIADEGKFVLCPCLEIQTGRGKLHRADFGAEWVDKNFQARRVRYELIEESGHWPWLENLDGFLTILEPFLSEHAINAR
jgi:pimeloyl-ACP methyl ester carboxylesterase